MDNKRAVRLSRVLPADHDDYRFLVVLTCVLVDVGYFKNWDVEAAERGAEAVHEKELAI
jgi:hypothetical protein